MVWVMRYMNKCSIICKAKDLVSVGNVDCGVINGLNSLMVLLRIDCTMFLPQCNSSSQHHIDILFSNYSYKSDLLWVRFY